VHEGAGNGSAPNDATPRKPGAGRHRRELHPRHVRGNAHVPLGRVLATPGALRALADARASAADLLARHAAGDWGDGGAEDWAANDRARRSAGRLLSAYRLLTGAWLWIITEADRRATTVLTPAEY